MKSRAIVTLADSNYFELLLELISSIKNYKESWKKKQTENWNSNWKFKNS